MEKENYLLDLLFLINLTFRKLKRNFTSLDKNNWRNSDYEEAVIEIEADVKDKIFKLGKTRTLRKEDIGKVLYEAYHSKNVSSFCFNFQTLKRMQNKLNNNYEKDFNDFMKNVIAIYTGFFGWRNFLNDCERIDFNHKEKPFYTNLEIIKNTNSFRKVDREIIKELLENPSMYLYIEGKVRAPEDDELIKAQVEVSCLRIVSFWDEFVTQEKQIDPEVFKNWTDFMKDLYKKSAPIQEHIRRLGQVYTKKLLLMLGVKELQSNNL